jgi:hypothetical protein
MAEANMNKMRKLAKEMATLLKSTNAVATAQPDSEKPASSAAAPASPAATPDSPAAGSASPAPGSTSGGRRRLRKKTRKAKKSRKVKKSRKQRSRR